MATTEKLMLKWPLAFPWLLTDLVTPWFRSGLDDSISVVSNTEDESEFRPIPVLDFENPQYLYETCQGGVDAILRGLIKDPAGKLDG